MCKKTNKSESENESEKEKVVKKGSAFMAFLKAIGSFFVGLVKFVRNIIYIGLTFALSVFILMIFFKEQTTYAIDFFMKLF